MINWARARAINNNIGKQAEERTPIATGLFLPNLSGDHSAGTTKEPVKDEQIANKAYVDDMGVAHLAAYDHTQLHPALTLSVANGLTLSTGQVLNFPTDAEVTISKLTAISGNIKAPNNNTTHINTQTSDGLSYLNLKDKSGYWVIEASNWNPGLVLEAGIGLGNNTALFNYNTGGCIYFTNGNIEVWDTNAKIYAKFYSASKGLSIGSTSAKTAPPINGLLVEGEAVFQSNIGTSGSISGADIIGSTIYSYGTIKAASIIMAEGDRRVACGGGSTGATTTANGTVTLSINGTTYYLLTAATA